MSFLNNIFLLTVFFVIGIYSKETDKSFEYRVHRDSIAIDVGASVGANSIFLSEKFHHVLAVEHKRGSLETLKKNLLDNDRLNVSLCERPVSNISKNIAFKASGFLDDAEYYVKSITFKQLIHDYIYANKDLAAHKISLINCDMEGQEEDVIEDILHFAFYNQCCVTISFNLDNWKLKKIEDFEYLFKYFTTNFPDIGVCEHLKRNPKSVLCFMPRKTTDTLMKKNIPAVIIGYNMVTYIKNMVEQLEKYTSDIIVVDNNSHYQPLLDYYENDFKYTLLRQKENMGHNVWAFDIVQDLTGDIYIITDPDLEFNPKLPDDFINNLINISNHYKALRVGFALCIDSPDIDNDLKFNALIELPDGIKEWRKLSVKEWEERSWENRLDSDLDSSLELYLAGIDTTFCLINRTCIPSKKSIRVAGDYTCSHLPWYKNFKSKLRPGEYEAYIEKNISSTWVNS